MYPGVHEINSKQILICSAKCVGGLKRLEVTEKMEMTLNLHFIIQKKKKKDVDWNV
jgi:hypothetical protein